MISSDPNGKAEATDKNSVLQFATKYSNAKCVAELLKTDRVDVNYCDGLHNQTALHMACEDDKLDILNLLLEKNAGLSAIEIMECCISAVFM